MNGIADLLVPCFAEYVSGWRAPSQELDAPNNVKFIKWLLEDTETLLHCVRKECRTLYTESTPPSLQAASHLPLSTFGGLPRARNIVHSGNEGFFVVDGPLLRYEAVAENDSFE